MPGDPDYPHHSTPRQPRATDQEILHEALTVMIRLNDNLLEITNAVKQLKTTMVEQSQLLQQVIGLLGVTVPAWLNLTEVKEGDDMGLVRPSAAELGLPVEIIPLQFEPGFEHEDVVSTDPPPGTLVARGTLVRVRVNFLG